MASKHAVRIFSPLDGLHPRQIVEEGLQPASLHGGCKPIGGTVGLGVTLGVAVDIVVEALAWETCGADIFVESIVPRAHRVVICPEEAPVQYVSSIPPSVGRAGRRYIGDLTARHAVQIQLRRVRPSLWRIFLEDILDDSMQRPLVDSMRHEPTAHDGV